MHPVDFAANREPALARPFGDSGRCRRPHRRLFTWRSTSSRKAGPRAESGAQLPGILWSTQKRKSGYAHGGGRGADARALFFCAPRTWAHAANRKINVFGHSAASGTLRILG
jgi:hypothetical protein